MAIVYILLGIVGVIILYIIVVFNGLVTLKTRCEEAWSDIDVQLKRRYDLIPNLVNTVKGYAKHEKELFEKVTEARAKAMGAKDIKEQGKAENMLTNALKSVFAVAENYPNLKANENFLHLQGELTDTENKIEASRRFYNANVRDLNIKIKSFPSNVIANTFKFEPKVLFEIAASQAEAAKEPPKVEM
ncbi:MAG: LemA family protein [Candidatus Berkelbacteria bacterium]|nr:LemA family protein [Candidatus Berkelbacteria bacterium]